MKKGTALLVVTILSIFMIFLVLPSVSAAWNSTYNIGLRHYYGMDTGTGATVIDDRGVDVGNQLNGTFNGNLAWNSSNCINDNCTRFDGTNSFVNLSRLDEWDVLMEVNNFTFSWWSNFDREPNPAMYTIGNADLGNTNGLFTYYVGSKTYSYYINGVTNILTVGSRSAQRWEHIVIRRNGTSASLWVNGTLVDTATWATIENSTCSFNLGFAACWNEDLWYEGNLDELAMWNRSLTDNEIQNLYNGGTGIFYAPDAPAILELAINSPLNQSYNVSSILFNVSGSDNLDICNFTINNWATNYSMTVDGISANYTNASMNDGQYNVEFWCNSTSNVINNTESVTFIVDTTYPQINYTETGNAINYANVSRDWIFVNVTWNETNTDSLLFRLHNSTGEVNVTSYTTFTDPYSINWTSLPDDTYTYNITLNDTVGFSNSTLTRTITLDNEFLINIVSPLNQSYNVSSILFNVSGVENLDICNFTINDWATNYSMTVNGMYANYTNASMDDGQYVSKFWCNDTSNNVNNTESITFIVDTTPPQINYSTGTPVDYANLSSTSIFVNTTWNETSPSAIVFRLHNETAEINVTTYSPSGGSTDITWTGLPEAVYTYNVTLNDSVGFNNSTLTRTVTLNQTNPLLTIVSPLNQSYNVSSILFNVSANKLLDICNFTINDWATNYSMTVDGMYANYTNASMNDGQYVSKFWCNDTSNNINNTENTTFIVDTTYPQINYTSPTPSSGTNQSFDSLYVNVNWTELFPDILLFRLHNSTGEYNVTSLSNITSITNGTGVYNTTAACTAANPCNNSVDGNWSSWAIVNHTDSPPSYQFDYIYENFTILSSYSAALWKIKTQCSTNGGCGTDNISWCYNSTDEWQPLQATHNSTLNQTVPVPSSCLQTNLSFRTLIATPPKICVGLCTLTRYFEGEVTWQAAPTPLNWTGLRDGIYFFNVTLNDTAGNTNTTDTRRIIIDTLNPNVSLISPSNYLNMSNLSVNFTALANDSGGIKNATLFIYNSTGGLYNSTTITFVAGVTSKTIGIIVALVDGAYSWFYEIFDWVDRGTNSTTYNFTIDNTTPIANITFPGIQINYHKNSTNLTFNWSFTEANPDTCFLDYTGSNFTVNCTDYSAIYNPVNITDYSNRNVSFWINDTSGNSVSFTRNWTYKFFEINTTFNSWSYEGDYQTFVLNMSTDNASRINLAYLIYNGSSYSATKGGSGTNITFTRSINVPMVGTDNQSFNWNVIYGDSNSNVSINSTYIYNQSIIPYNLVRCNSTVTFPYYNFTFNDEVNTTLSINASTDYAEFQYYLNNSLFNKTYTFTNATGNPSYGYCFTPPNRTVYVSSVEYEYSATNYPLRKWDNTSITVPANYTINKTLWLLSSIDGQYVAFTVSDTGGTALNGSEISITRVIDGNSVEIGQDTTDATGSATFFLYPAASHTVAITRDNCTGATFSLVPTQTSYAITLNCLSGATIGGNNNIEGVRYSRSPFVGGTTASGNITFDYYVVSLLYNITKVKFELYYNNETFITSNETFVPTSYCNATQCYMRLVLNVSAGDDIKARYYLAVNNTDTGETGYILLEGDAHWRFITTIASDVGTVKKVFTNLRDVFSSWTPVGTDPISGWNFTTLSCEQYINETSCNLGGCAWDNSTTNVYGACFDFNHLNRIEYSRIVFIFLFIAIILTIFGRLTGYDAQNPGAFLILITGLIGLGTFANGITGPGFFYYNQLTPIPFLNNTILFLTVGVFTIGYYLSLTRRYT